MIDIEAMNFKIYHILPYKIVSDEYGDYPYKGEYEDEDGELIAETLQDLIDKIDDLQKKYISAWSKGPDDRYGRNTVTKYYVECLRRWTERGNGWGQFDVESSSPHNGLKYPIFGTHRIELREFEDRSVELDISINERARLKDNATTYLKRAIIDASETLDHSTKAVKQADLVAKRAQYEKLKKEFGE